MNISHLLTLTCDIEEQTQTKTPTGGTLSEPYRAIYSGVPCGTMQLSGEAVIAYGREASKEMRRFYFDKDYNLQAAPTKRRIKFEGQAYDVVKVNNVNGYGRLWQVDTERKPL